MFSIDFLNIFIFDDRSYYMTISIYREKKKNLVPYFNLTVSLNEQ